MTKEIPEKTRQRRNEEKQQTMIQNLSGDFDCIGIESGAGESVCPVDAFPEYCAFKTERNGTKCRAARGQELHNAGEKIPIFVAGGVKTALTFHAAAGIRSPWRQRLESPPQGIE